MYHKGDFLDFSEIGQAFPIKNINLYQLDLPLKPSFPFRTNSSLTAIKPIIVEFIDLEDRVGWGSIDLWDHPFNPLQQDRTGAETWRIITQSFVPSLKQALIKPQLNPYRAVDQIHQITSKYPPIAAGFEMAYWDLLIRKENSRSVEFFWRLFFEEGRSQFEADDYDIMETKMKQAFNCKVRLQLAKDFHIIDSSSYENIVGDILK